MRSDHPLLSVAKLSLGAASSAAASAASSWAMLVFGVPLAVVFAAFAGAMVSLSFMSIPSLRRALVVLASGTLAGAYTSALVAEWLNFTPAAMGGLAFVVGGTLQWLAPAVIDRISRRDSGGAP